MIRHIIVEAGDAMVGPSVTGIHQNLSDAKRHMVSIYENHVKDGFTAVLNTDTCFTVTKGDQSFTFSLNSVRFD